MCCCPFVSATFAAPVMSLASSFTPPSNVIQQAPGLSTQPASLLDQSFVVGPGFSPVPAKLVTQIVGGKYVDLSDLLGPNLQQREPEPQLMFDGRLVLTYGSVFHLFTRVIFSLSPPLERFNAVQVTHSANPSPFQWQSVAELRPSVP